MKLFKKNGMYFLVNKTEIPVSSAIKYCHFLKDANEYCTQYNVQHVYFSESSGDLIAHKSSRELVNVLTRENIDNITKLKLHKYNKEEIRDSLSKFTAILAKSGECENALVDRVIDAYKKIVHVSFLQYHMNDKHDKTMKQSICDEIERSIDKSAIEYFDMMIELNAPDEEKDKE